VVYVALPRFPDDLQKKGKKHWLFTPEEIELATARFGCEFPIAPDDGIM
jgi:hypothetical protein